MIKYEVFHSDEDRGIVKLRLHTETPVDGLPDIAVICILTSDETRNLAALLLQSATNADAQPRNGWAGGEPLVPRGR